MALDLEKKIIEICHYAHGLRIFFNNKNSGYAPGLRKNFLISFFFHYAPGLGIFFWKWHFFTMLRDLNFCSSNFSTMFLDLKFIFEQKIFHHASGFGNFFEFYFFHHAPGLGKFFWKWKFSTMPLDLENFLKVFFPLCS